VENYYLHFFLLLFFLQGLIAEFIPPPPTGVIIHITEQTKAEVNIKNQDKGGGY
jgi:hypothetical protein